jgi:dTDP-4-dehydrorhamnose 3,5-epimerase
VPEAARGVRWDDPAFGIDWPAPHGERTMSAKDRGYPDFAP